MTSCSKPGRWLGVDRHLTSCDFPETDCATEYPVDRDAMLFIVITHTMYTLRTRTQWHTDCHRMIFSDCQPSSRDIFLRRFRFGRFPSLFMAPCLTAFRIRLCQFQLQHTTPYKLLPGSPSSTSLLLHLLFIGFYNQESSLVAVIYCIHSLTSP